MTRRRLVTLMVASAAIAGCGNSGSNGITPTAYRTKINSLCAANNAKIDALPGNTGNSLAGLKEEDAIIVDTLAKIKAVTPPSSLSSEVNTWIGVVDQESALATQTIDALQAGSLAKAKSLATKVASLNPQDHHNATSIGLSSCAATATPHGS